MPAPAAGSQDGSKPYFFSLGLLAFLLFELFSWRLEMN